MEFKTILLTKKSGIATLTLNRPEKLNSLTEEMLQEISTAIDAIAGDDYVKVVIITGAGRGFCAGADLQHPLFSMTSTVTRRRGMGSFHRIPVQLRSLSKPVIASVNGVAAGAGANLALSCDIIIAAEEARFGQVFVNIGVHVDTGGTYFLPRSVGVPKAMELMMTGEFVDAREAERIGMVNKVVKAADLAMSTRELAEKLAVGPPLALAMIKASVYRNLTSDLDLALEREADCQALLLNTEDNKEGINAFLEKRKPNFQGI